MLPFWVLKAVAFGSMALIALAWALVFGGAFRRWWLSR